MLCMFVIKSLSFRAENAAYNLSQARTILSNIEVVLGQLAINTWGETVFDYLPNLMYIGGFEGKSSLTFSNALVIASSNPADIPFSNVSLKQIHFPRLVAVPMGNIALIDNPDLCYIGELEYYVPSPSNQTVIYDTVDGIARKNYSDCGTRV